MAPSPSVIAADRFLPVPSPIAAASAKRRITSSLDEGNAGQNQSGIKAMQSRYHRRIARALYCSQLIKHNDIFKRPTANSPTTTSSSSSNGGDGENADSLKCVGCYTQGFSLPDDFYLNLLSWSPCKTSAIEGVYSGLIAAAVSPQTESPKVGHPIRLFSINRDYEIQNDRLLFDAVDFAIGCLAWNPSEESLLAIASRSTAGSATASGSVVRLYDCAKEQTKAEWKRPHEGRIGTAIWYDPWTLITGGKDGHLVIHDSREFSSSHALKFQGHAQEICGLAKDTAGLVATGGNDNAVHIWDIRSIGEASHSHPMQSILSHRAAIKALAFSPHHRNRLATGGGTADKTLRVWAVGGEGEHPEEIASVNCAAQICGIVWSPFWNSAVGNSGSSLMTTHGFSENQLITWNLRMHSKRDRTYRANDDVDEYTGTPKMGELIDKAVGMGHTSRVLFICHAPADSPLAGYVLTGSGDESIRLWRPFLNESKSLSNKRIALSPPLPQ